MPVLVLCPTNVKIPETIEALVKEKDGDERLERLTEEYGTDDYGSNEGRGVWIPSYMEFLYSRVQMLANTAFCSDFCHEISMKAFAQINNIYFRNLLIRFTNEHFKSWYENHVHVPSLETAHEECSGYCDVCDDGWEEVYGTYDGPRVEDVEPNEGATVTETIEQRGQRLARNNARDAERLRRLRAQRIAEAEILDREFTCNERCEGYYDTIDIYIQDHIHCDMAALSTSWDEFYSDKSMPDMKMAKIKLKAEGS